MKRAIAPIFVLFLLGCGSEDKKSLTFAPEWGTATSGFQVEGGNTTSDWYEWESLCGPKCSGDSNLDGPDFWNKYAADFAEAQAMGHTTFRMGIEWAKIEPTEGTYDTTVIAHYRTIMESARDHGLSLLVTLQHFTLPLWLLTTQSPGIAASGTEGWVPPGCSVGTAPIIDAFAGFAGDMAEEFGDLVDLWITINEPMVALTGSYVGEVFPPGALAQNESMFHGAHNMAYAHAKAYDAIHARDTTDADNDGEAASVSISKHWRIADTDPLAFSQRGATESAERFEFFFNRFFLDLITKGHVDLNADGDSDDEGELVDPSLQNKLDWLGINYYSRFFFDSTLVTLTQPGGCNLPIDLSLGFYDQAAPTNDMDWEIYPEGLLRSVVEAYEYGLPIRITENGTADEDDDHRPAFIVSHLKFLQRAVEQEGVEILGYYHWSLLDNFEWAEGYEKRFGLLHVDFEDPLRPRTRTRGAEAYMAVIAENGVTEVIEAEFGTIGE
jgi:beta-glucosidase/6-phospho-beta-glucosidase/beta-galactosidase